MLAVRNLLFAALCPFATAATSYGQQPGQVAETGSTRWASLPAEREAESQLAPLELPSDRDFARLLRPRWSLAGEWEPMSDGVEIRDVDARVTVPTYPFYGPPPPMLAAGLSFTDLAAPAAMRLPTSLYDISLGATWVRPLNERWTLRLVASAAFASDMDNTSSDAWQFRGGVFGNYEWTEDVQLILGAFATGRDDIPVLPGAGAIWTPTPWWRINLIMPRPRVSYLLAHTGVREHWISIGGGLSGGTWAFEQAGMDDKLTYREWRLGLGWESGPPRLSPFLPGDGLTLEAELAYVFGRQFEFERRTSDIGLDSTMLLRFGAQF